MFIFICLWYRNNLLRKSFIWFTNITKATQPSPDIFIFPFQNYIAFGDYLIPVFCQVWALMCIFLTSIWKWGKENLVLFRTIFKNQVVVLHAFSATVPAVLAPGLCPAQVLAWREYSVETAFIGSREQTLSWQWYSGRVLLRYLCIIVPWFDSESQCLLRKVDLKQKSTMFREKRDIEKC